MTLHEINVPDKWSFILFFLNFWEWSVEAFMPLPACPVDVCAYAATADLTVNGS